LVVRRLHFIVHFTTLRIKHGSSNSEICDVLSSMRAGDGTAIGIYLQRRCLDVAFLSDQVPRSQDLEPDDFTLSKCSPCLDNERPWNTLSVGYNRDKVPRLMRDTNQISDETNAWDRLCVLLLIIFIVSYRQLLDAAARSAYPSAFLLA
jgi:hypothetical protein